ncbi:MAG: hypothetical protein HYT50_00995 [Candidatus Wildermuthbacteria bacterium]|nr:hypothetical protein [Candidatus Wildermuthbacteria bacterium]
MQLSDLKGKKILILGFAREGKDTFSFLKNKFPGQIIGIADQKEDIFQGTKDEAVLHLGKNYAQAVQNYDVIIKSPGIPQKAISRFLSKNQILTSQTQLFFDNCQGTVIGVTGTKGKSTTSSLIYQVLKAGGISAHLIGNIGKPVLSFIEKQNPQDVFVYELSSFQLEHLTRSPHIAVLLNLYPEHLDRYQNFGAYQNAKARITQYQTKADFLVYNKADPLVARIAKQSNASLLPFTYKKTQAPWVASSEPARIIGKLFSIPSKTIEKAIQDFKPLPHRLQPVGTYQGISFYNDSLATIPESAIAALDALGPNVHTLIAGGFDRGVDMRGLAKRIGKSSIKKLVLFPTTGQKLGGKTLLSPYAKRKNLSAKPCRFKL